MYSLSTFCCVCLHDGEELQSLKDSDFDNVQLISKLKYCALQTDECILDDAAIYICIQCCHILRLAYNFKKMCIKNNKFIRGYVSQLKCTTSTLDADKTNISLQNLKDYVDNVPLAQHIMSEEKVTTKKKSPTIKATATTAEKQIRIKREQKEEARSIEPELLENFEPEINIHESDIKIDIIEHPIVEKEPTKTNNTVKKPELHPLTQNNDFQEKSSTQTLDLLKNLVHGTQSVAVDKLRELITKPIVEESNDDFLFQEKENERTTIVNDFETIFVKPEPSDDLEPEDHNNISGGESEDVTPIIPEEIQNLLNRHDNYCPICRKTFLCKSYYERHITMHTGIKNYECDVCHKRFTRKSTLKTHFMMHTGDASFTCTFCHKMFTQKGNLKSHMQTHLVAKNHRCYECGKNFTLKATLKTHLALHEKGKRQQCPICRKLIAKSYFVAHLNMHQEFRKIT